MPRATAKPLSLIRGKPGQVYADERWEKPREWLLGRYQARQYRRKRASNCRYRMIRKIAKIAISAKIAHKWAFRDRLLLATGNGKNNINGNGKATPFRRRLTLNDADQNFASIRYGVTTLVNTARNAGQTSVTEVHLRSRDG